MALNWLWKDKYGEMIMTETHPVTKEVRERKVSLYAGNALMIGIYHFEEDGRKMYSLDFFFDEKTHAKRCLGLDKEYGDGRNMFDDGFRKLVKLRLDKNKCGKADFNKIIKLFTDAFDELTIELYKEGSDEV